MKPEKYTKKPISIHAVQWDGTKAQAQRIIDWVHSNGAVATYWGPGERNADAPDAHYIVIETLEGDMLASPGDWIIQGIRGEFYPCKPDIFADTYVPAEGTHHHHPERNQQMTLEENLTRPPECCGKCPPTTTGYDCTCAGNPRCEGPNNE